MSGCGGDCSTCGLKGVEEELKKKLEAARQKAAKEADKEFDEVETPEDDAGEE